MTVRSRRVSAVPGGNYMPRLPFTLALRREDARLAAPVRAEHDVAAGA